MLNCFTVDCLQCSVLGAFHLYLFFISGDSLKLCTLHDRISRLSTEKSCCSGPKILNRARVRVGTLAEQERVCVTPGSGDVWGRGRGLLAGGVGVAEPRAEESVPDGDAGQLPEPGVAG